MLAAALSSPDQAFGSFFLSRLLGLEVTYGDDVCYVAFDVDGTKSNPQGTLHGGVMATAMDISMGHLLRRDLGPGATLEMKIQYLAPARSGRVVAEGRFLRRGRSVSFLTSTLVDEEGNTVAFATATWKVLKPPAD